MTETHKHHFQVADVGDWDLDQDRSIVPSIHTVLKNSGITAVVDGDEMNQLDSLSGLIHQEKRWKRP